AQNVTLEPPFHRVLAEHFHNSTVRCQLSAVSILRKVLAEPDLLTNFIDSLELIGLCLVWPKDPEVVHVSPRHFPEKIAESGAATGHGLARCDLPRVVARLPGVAPVSLSTRLLCGNTCIGCLVPYKQPFAMGVLLM